MPTGSWRTLAAAAALWLLGASAASAEWLRAESPNFIVYSESAEGRVREQVAKLEDFDRLLRFLSGTTTPPSPNKLNIYFVRGASDLRAIRTLGTGVAGFYAASAEGVIAAVDETTNQGEENNDTLFHEYAHHFMLQYHPAAYPAWYVEGFAEYVMTARIFPNRMEYGHYNRGRAYVLSDRRNWLPWERVLFPGDRPLRRDEVDRFYAQSWLLVHYLVRDDGRRASLRNYFTALYRGDEPRRAFAAAFGMSMTDLNRALQRYPDEMTFTRGSRASRATAPPITVTRLSASAGDLLLAQAKLRTGVPRGERAEFMTRVRRLAARYSDPLSRRLLAHAEILYGNPAAADPLLEALLAAAPGDAELLYLRGLRHLMTGRADAAVRAAEYRRAQPWFVRAHRANENHFQSLYRYSESLSLEPRFVSENTQNVLLLATHLAPQVPEIRLNAARLLLMRDQFETAEALLLPLAGSAHEGGSVTYAKRLLELARRRQRPGADEPAPSEEEAADEDQIGLVDNAHLIAH